MENYCKGHLIIKKSKKNKKNSKIQKKTFSLRSAVDQFNFWSFMSILDVYHHLGPHFVWKAVEGLARLI